MKLEKKQVPLFVGLCCVTVGMLGYAAFSLLGAGSAKPAAAGTTPVVAATPTLETPETAKTSLPALNPTFKSDPFKPAISVDAGIEKGTVPARSPEPVRVAVHETLPAFPPPTLEPAPFTPPAAPAVVHPAGVVKPAGPSAPAVNPAAAKPNITLTGILEGDNRVAILRLSDTQRQVVQEKDRVGEQYVVDEITPNAVVLVSGTERWRLFLDQ